MENSVFDGTHFRDRSDSPNNKVTHIALGEVKGSAGSLVLVDG